MSEVAALCRYEEKTSITDLFCNRPRAADGGGGAEKLLSLPSLPLDQLLMNQHAPLSDRQTKEAGALFYVVPGALVVFCGVDY